MVGAVCHGPGAFVNVKLGEDKYLVTGKRVCSVQSVICLKLGLGHAELPGTSMFLCLHLLALDCIKSFVVTGRQQLGLIAGESPHIHHPDRLLHSRLYPSHIGHAIARICTESKPDVVRGCLGLYVGICILSAGDRLLQSGGDRGRQGQDRPLTAGGLSGTACLHDRHTEHASEGGTTARLMPIIALFENLMQARKRSIDACMACTGQAC